MANYIYRIDHDTGFAPNIGYNLCSLCGCKRNSIEKWATKGSWVIGVGGNKTGVRDKIIYVMEVDNNIPFSEFSVKFPGKSKYLLGKCHPSDNVLYSRKFYYFGNNAILFPPNLHHVFIRFQGCKKISHSDVTAIIKYISSLGFSKGVHGVPNNCNQKQC